MTLDDFLPEYDFSELHTTRVRAAPDEVLAAARAVTSREVPLMVVLMALRRPWAVGSRGDRETPILEAMTRSGFVVLADRPDELVAGIVGKFWRPSSEIRRVSRDDFEAFHEPGFAKGVVNFHVAADGDGTLLTTETRVQATDDGSRRSFGRYWRVIRPGSGAIRRAWLRAIRKRAEHPKGV